MTPRARLAAFLSICGLNKRNQVMEKTAKSEKDEQKPMESPITATQPVDSEASDPVEKQAGQDLFKKIQDELAEAKDKYLRLYAEFDNYRRRTSREKLDMIQGANEGLLKALLPVLDDFDRAEKAFRELNNKEAEGLLLIHNKYKKILEQFGVKAMEVGDSFNPDLHEAITQVPVGDDRKKGSIVEVVERGYLLNDKVIRFAKVVVGA
jgi:molecular chaperone GrpE